MMFRRCGMVFALLAMVFSGVGFIAAAPPSYVVTDLGTLGGESLTGVGSFGLAI